MTRFVNIDTWRPPHFDYERGDCSVRAVMLAFGLSYCESHALLKALGRRSRCGFSIRVLYENIDVIHKRTLRHYWLEKKPTLAEFLDKHKTGIYIVTFSSHTVAVMRGIYYDTKQLDEKRRRIRTIYKVVRASNRSPI